MSVELAGDIAGSIDHSHKPQRWQGMLEQHKDPLLLQVELQQDIDLLQDKLQLDLVVVLEVGLL